MKSVQGMLWDEDAALSGASYDVRECDVMGLPFQQH